MLQRRTRTKAVRTYAVFTQACTYQTRLLGWGRQWGREVAWFCLSLLGKIYAATSSGETVGLICLSAPDQSSLEWWCLDFWFWSVKGASETSCSLKKMAMLLLSFSVGPGCDHLSCGCVASSGLLCPARRRRKGGKKIKSMQLTGGEAQDSLRKTSSTFDLIENRFSTSPKKEKKKITKRVQMYLNIKMYDHAGLLSAW